MLSLYPPAWRARYGEEFTELLRETIRDGHAGPRMTVNVLREAIAASLASASRRNLAAIACWPLGSILLFPQGLVPLTVKLTGGTHRSWFVALYLPGSLQWPMIAAMVCTGLLIFMTAIRTLPALRAPR